MTVVANAEFAQSYMAQPKTGLFLRSDGTPRGYQNGVSAISPKRWRGPFPGNAECPSGIGDSTGRTGVALMRVTLPSDD
jgi:hypothetical protein